LVFPVSEEAEQREEDEEEQVEGVVVGEGVEGGESEEACEAVEAVGPVEVSAGCFLVGLGFGLGGGYVGFGRVSTFNVNYF
jgi:hypothetical protein